jgi:hypothetical protein
MARSKTVQVPSVPSLPIAPREYTEAYPDTLNNILRLFFNQVVEVFRSILGADGGRFFQNPHIAASDSTDQYATADDTPTVVRWDTLAAGSGFTLQAPGSAFPSNIGVYKITYSLQFVNTANEAHDAVVWLRVDGVDVANSTTLFSIPARKNSGAASFVCGYSEVIFTITADSVVELVWATDKAYNTTGPVEGVYMFADTAQTTPYVRPAIPSAIGSILFVSAVTV